MLRLSRVRRTDDRGVAALLARSDRFHSALYPPESIHATPLAAFLRDAGAFYAGYTDEGPVACGGFLLRQDAGRYAEIKRLFVDAEFRGRGFATSIMMALEQLAQEAGVTVSRLETGTLQPEAIRLYRRLGYRQRGPFGRYGADPLSVFMEKSLLRAASPQD